MVFFYRLSTLKRQIHSGLLLLVFGMITVLSAEQCIAGTLTENLRATIDVSSRNIRYSQAQTNGDSTVIGLDLHKVFSNQHGDIGTLTAQAYWTDNNNIVKHPGFFDNEDDNRVVYRIFNFNYSGFGIGKPRLRFGHFEIPFGLEQVISTNGTLRDYMHGPNLGVKADWGASINGETAHLEYEVGVTRGGGQTWHRDEGDFVYAGRVGTHNSGNIAVGFSLYTSELGSTQRDRVALDMQWHMGLVSLLGELSLGNTNNEDIRNTLIELNHRSVSDTWLTFLQVRSYAVDRNVSGWDRALQSQAGIRFNPDNHWSFSTQYQTDFATFSGVKRDRLLSVQLRYRF